MWWGRVLDEKTIGEVKMEWMLN